MPTITIQQGDDLPTIAIAQGFDPDTLWDHPDNAELKELRSDPNALLPGDQLVVPPIEEREEGVATGSVGRFKLSVGPLKLRVRLTKFGEARADEPFELIFEDEHTISGSTDGDGWIDEPIPITAKKVTLSLREGKEEHHLQLGHLDPHDEPSGVQQRLRNLGFYFGALDGEHGPVTAGALRSFQTKQGLTVSGEADDDTMNALRDAHGS